MPSTLIPPTVSQSTLPYGITDNPLRKPNPLLNRPLGSESSTYPSQVVFCDRSFTWAHLLSGCFSMSTPCHHLKNRWNSQLVARVNTVCSRLASLCNVRVEFVLRSKLWAHELVIIQNRSHYSLSVTFQQLTYGHCEFDKVKAYSVICMWINSRLLGCLSKMLSSVLNMIPQELVCVDKFYTLWG